MRRQIQAGRHTPAVQVSVGASRAERLDPFSLPVRFAVWDKTADERVRQVELTRERVVLRRKTGDARAPRTVHRGEHEIIARN